jgi:hypothetical protein
MLEVLRMQIKVLLFGLEDEFLNTPEMIGPLDAHKGDIYYDFHITSEVTNAID